MIGYLDLPSGISGDMFLGCLVDAGWPVERLRAVVCSMGLSDDEWSVEARQVLKASVRATLVDVRAAEGRTQRRLSDVLQLIGGSDLPGQVKDRAAAVFTRLAHAEARVHGTTPEEIHFHEVGAVDAVIDVVGVIGGFARAGRRALVRVGGAFGAGVGQGGARDDPAARAGDAGTARGGERQDVPGARVRASG